MIKLIRLRSQGVVKTIELVGEDPNKWVGRLRKDKFQGLLRFPKSKWERLK